MANSLDTYPDKYSSTETYENILNLDRINVFLQSDSHNLSNQIFFSISGLPQQLSYGKHYFNLSIFNPSNSNYRLKPYSQILFEFKSKNNVVLRSDISNVDQGNGVLTCFVDILEDPRTTRKEVEDGEGTLNIVGILENKSDISTENIIPNHWLDKINYRLTLPIQIRKNLIGADSPTITNTTHQTKTINGAFSFARFSIPPRGNTSITYNSSTGEPSSYSIPGGGHIID
tara:strand:+ start:54 stop:743 length:690 start_codon:yes stop_codon:yes gene_type:complete